LGVYAGSYFAFLAAAQRFFCAVAILARASSLRTRFLAVFTSVATFELFGRPTLFFAGEGGKSESMARACWSFLICSSIAAKMASLVIVKCSVSADLHTSRESALTQ
jgi:hypothetical protein